MKKKSLSELHLGDLFAFKTGDSFSNLYVVGNFDVSTKTLTCYEILSTLNLSTEFESISVYLIKSV